MKIYNTCDAVGVATDKPKWYRRNGFSLIPIFWYRPMDDHNATDFGFSWLWFTGWTMMSPDIGVEVEIDDCGFLIGIRVPYFKMVFRQRLFPKSWHQKSWRKGKLKY